MFPNPTIFLCRTPVGDSDTSPVRACPQGFPWPDTQSPGRGVRTAQAYVRDDVRQLAQLAARVDAGHLKIQGRRPVQAPRTAVRAVMTDSSPMTAAATGSAALPPMARAPPPTAAPSAVAM